MNPKTLLICVALLWACAFNISADMVAQTSKTSGIYLTAADYENRQIAFEGNCRSKAHQLELHDVLNKSYIHVTHDFEKRRYEKKDLFGFRACNGQDYRFGSNFEYEILEAGQLYVYARDILKSNGRSNYTVREYYFSVGNTGQIQGLTVANLKQAFPGNHRFQALLDSTFGSRQRLSEYDESKRMFKVNQLLVASRE